MTVDRYPNLLSPARLGTLSLKNRLIWSGHGMRLAENGVPGDRLRAYLVERARGGVGLINMESAPVHRTSYVNQNQIHLFSDDVIPHYRQISEALHLHGVPIQQILWHNGHAAAWYNSELPVWAPSVVPGTSGEVPHAMTVDEIQELIAAYGAAARRCREGGLDGVEVQTAADYLLGSFLSPSLNRRTDQYGGSRENRVRIVVEVLEGVRRVMGPDRVVAIRTSGDHFAPGGLDLEEVKAILRLIESTGLIDYVSVVAGSYYSLDVLLPTLYHPRGNAVSLASAIKGAITLPVVVAGRLRTPVEMEHVIASGSADFVATARTLIADPDFPDKVRAGREAEIRPCISCNQGCWGMVAKGRRGGCIVNARAGREVDLGDAAEVLRSVDIRRRVLVVGGGPAGLEAARVAASRGHDVHLDEAGEVLGGRLVIAAAVPGRSEMSDYLDWLIGEVRRLGVTVRIGHLVTADEIAEGGWDSVIVATGAVPSQVGLSRLAPENAPLPGSDHPAVHWAQDVISDPGRVAGDRVLIIDEDGLSYPAAGAAELLAKQGKAVQIVTSQLSWGMPELVHTLDLGHLQRRLSRLGLSFRPQRIVLSLDLDAHEVTMLDLVAGEAITDGPWDAVVLATGWAANDSLAEQIRGKVEHLQLAGDCLAPRRIMAATMEGYRAGSTV